MRPFEYRPAHQEMLGDVPLLRSFRWQDIDYTTAHGLEHLQRKLFREQQRSDGVVVLNAKRRARRWGWRYYECNHKIIFHPDVLPHWQAFTRALKERGGLAQLSIDRIMLPPSFFNGIMEQILTTNIESLTCLELTSVVRSPNDLFSIAEIISKLPALANLDLSSNTIDDVSAAESLAVAINNHSELVLANFSECNLGTNIDVFAQILDGVPNLKTVLLDRNKIKTPEAMTLVADFIEDNATVTIMSLEENMMGDDNLKLLGNALKKNSQLSQIGLRLNEISIISPILDSNSASECLTHLDLSSYLWRPSCERISSMAEAQVIAEYLGGNPALVELNLEGNKIPGKAIKLFASALKDNTNLQTLNLAYNRVSDASVPALVDMLKCNTTLRSLNVAGNEGLKYKTGRKGLMNGAICDVSSLASIAESNHTCVLRLSENGSYMNNVTHELEMRGIQSLDNEGKKIRYKVCMALFVLNTELFDQRNFNDVPLELMPRLLEIAQQEIGYNGFGVGMRGMKIKQKRSGNELRRIYATIQGWPALPVLFMRGPGKLKKKRKRKVPVDDDEEWTPASRGGSNYNTERRTSLSRALKKNTNYAE